MVNDFLNWAILKRMKDDTLVNGHTAAISAARPLHKEAMSEHIKLFTHLRSLSLAS